MVSPNAIRLFLAGRDFEFLNLRVKKGEPLPEAWQSNLMARKLVEKYGEDAVVLRTMSYERKPSEVTDVVEKKFSPPPDSPTPSEPQEESSELVSVGEERGNRRKKRRRG